MPVTAKLSKKFYETFGEDVTNERVEWFNSVDTTYRANLRELIKWMFTFWAPTALGIVGTAIAVVALLLRR